MEYGRGLGTEVKYRGSLDNKSFNVAGREKPAEKKKEKTKAGHGV